MIVLVERYLTTPVEINSKVTAIAEDAPKPITRNAVIITSSSVLPLFLPSHDPTDGARWPFVITVIGLDQLTLADAGRSRRGHT